jgi:hypothetical protein
VKKPIKMYHPIFKSQVPLPIIWSITLEVGVRPWPLEMYNNFNCY